LAQTRDKDDKKMKKIAIIGSGVSGLTCAYLLAKKYEVTVFEKNNYIGGHTATVDIDYNGEQHAIDTGFIVCNNKTYPNFLKLLSQIGVNHQDAEMSFSVHNVQSKMEYNGNGLNSLFAQRSNILKPKFWLLIKEILRFNKLCKALYQQDIDVNLSLGDFLTDEKFSEYFCQHYILPMGAAIWSTSLEEMKDFELKFFVRFFYNHGLLNITDRPQWHVIKGGSREYIKPLIKDFADNILLNSSITSITRHESHVIVALENGDQHEFDEIVLACHSDQALALLGDESQQEQAILGSIPYSKNDVVLHADESVLPKRKLAWASWNYRLDFNNPKPAAVTYNMNILQGLKSDTTFCVTLNQTEQINPDKIIRKFVYHHPVFNKESMQAQQRRDEICGKNRTHFCGAYWYNGFHEDGVRSAVDVAKRFGCEL
jgi:predicted NAD/FAD-binding protein